MQDPIIFTGSPLDRAGNARRDAAWLAAQMSDPDSRFLLLHRLKVLIDLTTGGTIGWRPHADVAAFLDQGAMTIFLGLADGVAHFGIDVSAIENPKAEPYGRWGKFIDVRAIAGQLPAGHAAVLAQARAMIDWHGRHGFCAECGAPSQIAEGGYARKCSAESCGAMHFPRTDPVVIMLIEQDGDCLLGRQKMFATGSYSALAGFMEPGESIEEAVRREVVEEVGVTAGAVRYIASQHWPFPSSLMIGCVAEAMGRDITLDPKELEDARWFSKDDIRAMVDNSLGREGLRMPPPLSLAHQLALRWLDGQ
jgi:NAD+ diphosphatase